MFKYYYQSKLQVQKKCKLKKLVSLNLLEQSITNLSLLLDFTLLCVSSGTVRYSAVPGTGGECAHLSSFGDDQETDGGVGEGVGGAGAPVKWPRGDLEMLLGVLSPRRKKAWESALRS